LILATHRHAPEPHHDAALLADADLASFGRTADKVGAHKRAIFEKLF
jgi:predicted metal-dependent HD superfamily phosphohydrolase